MGEWAAHLEAHVTSADVRVHPDGTWTCVTCEDLLGIAQGEEGWWA